MALILLAGKNGAQVFGLTLPLITKSMALNLEKQKEARFGLMQQKRLLMHQFGYQQAMLMFTRFCVITPLSEDINAIEQRDKAITAKPEAQLILAAEMTRFVHGEKGLKSAQRITHALFGGIQQLV